MTQWAWIDHRGKPVFNFRSENRSFASSDRRLIPSDGFYEFTVPANPKPRLKDTRSEEHTSELQSLMRISYAVFCLKKKNTSNREIPRLILKVTKQNTNKERINRK